MDVTKTYTMTMPEKPPAEGQSRADGIERFITTHSDYAIGLFYERFFEWIVTAGPTCQLEACGKFGVCVVNRMGEKARNEPRSFSALHKLRRTDKQSMHNAHECGAGEVAGGDVADEFRSACEGYAIVRTFLGRAKWRIESA